MHDISKTFHTKTLKRSQMGWLFNTVRGRHKCDNTTTQRLKSSRPRSCDLSNPGGSFRLNFVHDVKHIAHPS